MKAPALLPIAFLGSLSLFAANPAMHARENAEPDEGAVGLALNDRNFDKVIELTESVKAGSPLARHRSEAFHRRGVLRYFEGKVKESIADFDAHIELEPDRDPYHWQRGISYYHAGEYQKGKEQFERHQTVNPQDVENAVFHFICAVRAPGGSVEEARKDFIRIERDTRVPMKQIHAMFAGTGSAEEVLEAAGADGQTAIEKRNHLCYAHLYLGLYYEALGDAKKSAEHMELAAGKYKMDHYMGKVAQVHLQLRKAKTEKSK